MSIVPARGNGCFRYAGGGRRRSQEEREADGVGAGEEEARGGVFFGGNGHHVDWRVGTVNKSRDAGGEGAARKSGDAA